MPRRTGVPSGRCVACAHLERYRLEMLIAGGASYRAVARKFSMSYHSLRRHWVNHVTAERKAALIAGPIKFTELAERAAEEDMSLLDSFKAINSTLWRAMGSAVDAGDRYSIAILSGKLVDALREMGRLTGELRKSGGINIQNNIFISPQFAELQATLVRVLAPYPEARASVIEAFRALEAKAHQQSAASLLEGSPGAVAA